IESALGTEIRLGNGTSLQPRRNHWNAVSQGSASVERGGAGQRECGTRWRGATRVWNAEARGHASVERLVAAATAGSPVLKHGPSPPAAEEGVNALEDVERLSPIVRRRVWCCCRVWLDKGERFSAQLVLLEGPQICSLTSFLS
ncbi:MAG: hypothetical protein QGF59_20895, partial [Pirellulaceae bacterium]|nr:hypothetical protein [Pirellulaceae bacterium]